jgi:FkbM family methyltransferase
VDIGANVGLFAVLASARGARVRAFEPHPEVFGYLARNTAPFDVECVRAAVVGREAHEVALYPHPKRHDRHTLTGREPVDGEALDASGAIMVPAISLQHVLDERVDLLKIDCEGAEFEILADTTMLAYVSRIVGEVHSTLGDAESLMDDLRGAGFAVRTRLENQGKVILFAAQR